ncbi:LuxR C-terminal-related transcriptional regulator [Symbioplanes lichenis]|uniref:LuxR C-terminal-related transcriptional regulator n=1 Tax=Symbioplanes lichenis TaxID=1629072 RepID=UPI0027393E65|nr:LuxR family transcriptional regulator [Actinoplanes lichenis]
MKTLLEPPAGPLVGQDDARRAVSHLLGAGEGGALMVSGPIGSGKTAVLDHAVALAQARGLTVLRVTGAGPAGQAPCSGLTDLLDLLLELAAGSPAQEKRVADIARRCRDGERARIPKLANAVRAVLRHARAASPLIAVDDVHRMDPISTQVLCVLGTRLTGTGARLIATVRTTTGRTELHGLPLHPLEPLDETAAHTLLQRRFPQLSARVRRQIVGEAGGNPLALRELPLPLTRTQREVAAALPTILPLTERLQELYRPQVEALPPGARHVLLAAALEGTGDLTVLEAFAGPELETALRQAEDAHLAGVDDTGSRLVFRHPLARATVVALATPGQRRSAHRRLAEALIDRPELHAWHLSQSVIAADSTTAELLHDAALKAMSRGAVVSAVRLMTRSADLSADPRRRAQRLGYAATMSADGTGDLDAASRLVRNARENDPDFDDTLPAIVAAATTFLLGDGDTDTAAGLLVSALEARTAEQVESVILLKSALWTLLRVCRLSGRPELWDVFLRLVGKYRTHLTTFEITTWQAAADPARADAARLAVVDRKIASAMTDKDPNKIIRLAEACAPIDRLGELRAALWRVAENGRNGHQPTTHAIRALNFLCADALVHGRWSDVDSLSAEIARLCEENGQRALSWLTEGSVAVLAALRGDTERTRTLTRELVAWAVPRDARVILLLAAHARMLEALGAADFEAAYHYAAEAGLPDPALPSSIEQMQMSFDVVLATVHTGRQREAELCVRAMQASEMPSLSPRLALQTAACAALVAPRARAARSYESALALPGVNRLPYDRARIQLAYGEHLRRVRATNEARRHLRTALTAFQDLGAQPWAARAKAELRAAGDRDTAAEPDDPAALTPQELAIIRLAADGLTNKQIGQRLFLSPRTVGNHLYRAYPKLGITSRASLRDALAALRLDPAGASAS